MTGVATVFEDVRAEGRAALVGYLPAGFPTVEGSIQLVQAMVDSGVDIIEVGLPYSDPVMDGPTIQAAAEVALAAGVRIADVFTVVEQGAKTVPTLVMTYWNPVERFGVERFCDDLTNAGGAGLITPDLIPEEADEWVSAADARTLDKVFLVAPSSTKARLESTTAACRGFVYAAAVMGVTGAREESSTLAPSLVARVKDVSDLPVGVGIGVSNGTQATEVAQYADAVIVGSALVRAVQRAGDLPQAVDAVSALISELADGVRREL